MRSKTQAAVRRRRRGPMVLAQDNPARGPRGPEATILLILCLRERFRVASLVSQIKLLLFLLLSQTSSLVSHSLRQPTVSKMAAKIVLGDCVDEKSMSFAFYRMEACFTSVFSFFE